MGSTLPSAGGGGRVFPSDGVVPPLLGVVQSPPSGGADTLTVTKSESEPPAPVQVKV